MLFGAYTIILWISNKETALGSGKIVLTTITYYSF